ncbi:uncharacterized protein LOC119981430 isoform X2 [Tripterygium wilfordii]|uniref:uncharacterized protein LOC119981430 isoform X2 n=1 Tax=Tripterygium wilfordii TaxID=458696 RepID=UPI0018F81954|nr:uncharacterized protein LOC119981430 isoform X2 [Tripterygium wilfordii]XP_038680461.1 uncharacterized protein LOC119981430 isoform X2 [Tripterygium wilfordii]
MMSSKWNEDGSSESVVSEKQITQNHSSPWIVPLPKEESEYRCISTATPPYEIRRRGGTFPDLGDKQVKNCCYGWLILLDENDYQISLQNPLTSQLIHLPPLKSKQPQICILSILLSSSPCKTNSASLDPNCKVFLFEYNLPSLWYCVLGEKHWNTVCYCKKRKHALSQPFILNGALYARQGQVRKKLYCIHNIKPTHIDMRKFCDLPCVPEFACTTCFDHLVESYGELFYIIISKGGINIAAVLDIRVFKFNQESLRWHKVKRAQDRVFFLGREFDISYLATGDIKGGFIYIAWQQYFYIYSFEDHSLSKSLPRLMWNIPKTCGHSRPIILFGPDLRHVEQNLGEPGRSEVKGREVRQQTNHNANMLGTNEGESQLFNLPIDTLTFITRLLSPVDYINFRATSRTCRSVLPQIQWREPSISSHAAPLLPWFISSDEISGIHSFVDSKLGGKYFINISKTLLDAKILHSNNGWLLMSRGLKALSFYNPFAKEIIKLPKPPKEFFRSSSIGFSSSPKSPECTVVAIHAVDIARIYVLRIREKEWRHYAFDIPYFDNHDLVNNPQEFETSNNSPVFCDGALYVLGQYGSLGVFELQGREQGTWRIIYETEKQDEVGCENFLLECDKKLLSIFIGRAAREVNVYALNRSSMSWEKIENLENYALFVSRSSSFSTLVKSNGMGNRIFLPRLHDNSIVSYCFKTREYHCFARQDDVVEYHNTRELLSASWIEPSWQEKLGNFTLSNSKASSDDSPLMDSPNASNSSLELLLPHKKEFMRPRSYFSIICSYYLNALFQSVLMAICFVTDQRRDKTIIQLCFAALAKALSMSLCESKHCRIVN